MKPPTCGVAFNKSFIFRDDLGILCKQPIRKAVPWSGRGGEGSRRFEVGVGVAGAHGGGLKGLHA